MRRSLRQEAVIETALRLIERRKNQDKNNLKDELKKKAKKTLQSKTLIINMRHLIRTEV